MVVEKIEYIVFFVIIILQFISFVKTRRKIKQFNRSVADISTIEIAALKLTQQQIDEFSTTENIFNETAVDHTYNEEGEEIEEEIVTTETIKLKLLKSEHGNSNIFNKILSSINKYLIRNRHSVADFSLIKDMVERNTNTLEDEINLTLSTPLYLGLMGTMLGIVIGIFSMSDFIGDTAQASNISEGIAILLSSVKIAMVASFLGLMLTIINSAVTFKGSKYKLESKKNDFYSFIQVELLPSLNQGMEATFGTLQRNLFSFNEKFDQNLGRLSTVFDKNYDAILMQKKLMEQIDSSEMVETGKYNLKVLKQLNISLESFDKFNAMFANINSYLANSYKLTQQSNELLDRTANFEKIADTISSNLNDNTKLIHFLSDHFSDLETHKDKVDEALIDVGFSIRDTFQQLNQSLKQSSELLGEEAVLRNIDSKKVFDDFSSDLKSSLIQQVETVQKIMEEKRSSLDYLKHLEALLMEVRALKGEGKTPAYFSEQMNLLQTGIYSTNETLKRIELDAKEPLFKKLFKQRHA